MGAPGTFHSLGSGWANASNTPWRLYKHFNHEGGINSPCILCWPGRTERAGQLDETPAHVIDLVPTILQAASLDSPDGATLAGQSLLPLLRGDKLPQRMLFFEHEGNRAVTDGRWKLVAIRDQDWELYDLSVDRTETHDLSDRFPQRVTSLREAWQAWADVNQVTPLPSDYQVEYLRVSR
jgi:arylsulfatase